MSPAATPPESLTVVIVSHGLDTLLRFCLEALDRALAACPGLARHTVVVVDNASPAPYRAEAVAATLLRFDTHRSFAAANNAAVAAHPAAAYLLLNNDVLLERGAIAEMLAALRATPALGICGSRLLFPDGTIQHCGVVFGDEAGPYHVARGRPAHTVPRRDRECQAVTGACLLVRAAVWAELGGLATDYPFGLEDVDFCLRARQRGWRVRCCGGSESLHFESMTPGRVARDVASRAHFAAQWRGRYSIDG